MGLVAFFLIGGPWVAATAWLWLQAGGVEAWQQFVHGATPSSHR